MNQLNIIAKSFGCAGALLGAILYMIAPLAHAEIKLGVNDWPGYIAWYIAEQKGFFKQRGANVKLVWFDTLTQSVDDFAAGKIDANAQTWNDTLVHISKGVPLKVILAIDYSSGADALMVAPKIAKLGDLKGKKVGLEQGTIAQFILGTALSKVGLTEKDVQLVNLPAGDATAAFLDGKLDAAAVWNPFVNQIQESRKGRPLFSSKDMPGMVADVLAVHEKSLQDKRAEYLGMVRAWYDVEKFLRDHREEAVKIMATIVKQAPENYRIFLPGVRFLNEKDNLDAFAAASNPRSLTKVSPAIIKFLNDTKLIQGNVNFAPALDASLVQEATKR